MRVEVLEHATPYPVDRAVRFIHDYQVERIGRHLGAVLHAHRRLGHEVVDTGVVDIRHLASLQHAIHPLNRRDDHARTAQHARRRQLVHRVQLGEAPAISGRAVVLELGERLIREIVAVDEEQDAAESAEREQPIGLSDRSEGLSRAGGHLDERAREPLFGE